MGYCGLPTRKGFGNFPPGRVWGSDKNFVGEVWGILYNANVEKITFLIDIGVAYFTYQWFGHFLIGLQLFKNPNFDLGEEVLGGDENVPNTLVELAEELKNIP